MLRPCLHIHSRAASFTISTHCLLASDSIAISTGASHEDVSARQHVAYRARAACERDTDTSPSRHELLWRRGHLHPARRSRVEISCFLTYATYKLLTDQPLFNGSASARAASRTILLRIADRCGVVVAVILREVVAPALRHVLALLLADRARVVLLLCFRDARCSSRSRWKRPSEKCLPSRVAALRSRRASSVRMCARQRRRPSRGGGGGRLKVAVAHADDVLRPQIADVERLPLAARKGDLLPERLAQRGVLQLDAIRWQLAPELGPPQAEDGAAESRRVLLRGGSSAAFSGVLAAAGAVSVSSLTACSFAACSNGLVGGGWAQTLQRGLGGFGGGLRRSLRLCAKLSVFSTSLLRL